MMPIVSRPSSDVAARPLGLGVALSVIAIAQIATSFGIQWYTVAQLGTGAETDALYAGATLFQIAIIVMVEPLGFVLTPMLAVMNETERQAVRFLLFWAVLICAAFLALLLWLAVPLVAPLFTPGFSEPTMQLTAELMRIQLIGLAGAGSTLVLSSTYHAEKSFIRPAVSVLIWSLIGWCVLLGGIQSGRAVLAAWVQVLCYTGPVLLLVPVIAHRPLHGPSNVGGLVHEAWRRLKPLMISAAYYRTGFIVDRFLTSFLAPGSVVIVELVWRIHTALVRILNQGITTPILPLLATLSNQESWAAFKECYRERLKWLALLSLGAFVGLVAMVWVLPQFYESGGNLVFGRLTPHDLGRLMWALIAGSGVLLLGGINHLLMNAFYAQGDTRTPTRILMLTYSVGIVLKCGGYFFGGLFGIVTAISLHYAIEGVFLGMALRRHLKLRLDAESQPLFQLSVAGD